MHAHTLTHMQVAVLKLYQWTNLKKKKKKRLDKLLQASEFGALYLCSWPHQPFLETKRWKAGQAKLSRRPSLLTAFQKEPAGWNPPSLHHVFHRPQEA